MKCTFKKCEQIQLQFLTSFTKSHTSVFRHVIDHVTLRTGISEMLYISCVTLMAGMLVMSSISHQTIYHVEFTTEISKA